MKCFTWSGGGLSQGLKLSADEKLGKVVFLGEAGRGRRYEKVALDRRNPAEVVNDCVHDAHAKKIILPPKDGKPEKVFYVLEKPQGGSWSVLVRIYTHTSYIRGAHGHWTKAAGEPEDLISGYGAFGDAGRIGSWNDGLVVMKPCDALRVKPSRGDSYALWIDQDGQPQTALWQDYENLQAVAQAEATMAEAQADPQALKIAFGQMSCFTYVGRGEIQPGLVVSKGVTGQVVALGEHGRGRELFEVPLIGFEAERVENTSVVVLSETITPARYYGEQPAVKRIYGLTQTGKREQDVLLVRVMPTGGGRSYRRTKVLRGEPTLIAYGVEASGTAGRAGSWDDTLWVFRPNDAVVIEGSEKIRVIENLGGKLVTTPWEEWEIADGKANPVAYVGNNKAPWGHAPAEWVGRVVQVIGVTSEYDDRSRQSYAVYRQTHEGELISVNPLVVNLGWDGRDRKDVTIGSGVWVKLDTCKTVRRLEGDALRERETVKATAQRQQSEAKQLCGQPHFFCLAEDLRQRISRVAEARDRWGETQCDFELMSAEELRQRGLWVQQILDEAGAVDAEARAMHRRRESGEVLVEFGGHFRVMGRTGNAQYWVIKPDGTERQPDEVSYRKRYTSEGHKKWRLVEPEELAISWEKSCSAAPHEFVVNKLPIGGCAPEQLAFVAKLEEQISADWEGAHGLASGEPSPDIGLGWNLKPQKSEPATDTAEKSEPADLSALTTLFGVKVRRK